MNRFELDMLELGYPPALCLVDENEHADPALRRWALRDRARLARRRRKGTNRRPMTPERLHAELSVELERAERDVLNWRMVVAGLRILLALAERQEAEDQS